MVFLVVGGITALVARLVTPAGAGVLWIGGTLLLIRFLARLVAYPGSVNSVRRSIEYGFGKSIATKTKEVRCCCCDRDRARETARQRETER